MKFEFWRQMNEEGGRKLNLNTLRVLFAKESRMHFMWIRREGERREERGRKSRRTEDKVHFEPFLCNFLSISDLVSGHKLNESEMHWIQVDFLNRILEQNSLVLVVNQFSCTDPSENDMHNSFNANATHFIFPFLFFLLFFFLDHKISIKQSKL